MEFELLSKWGGLLGVLLGIMNGVWLFISRSAKPFNDKFEKVDKAIGVLDECQNSHDRRIQTVEDKMAFLPSKDEVHKMQLAMAEMKGSLGIQTKSLEATERTVRRIDEYLRETGK